MVSFFVTKVFMSVRRSYCALQINAHKRYKEIMCTSTYDKIANCHCTALSFVMFFI